MQPYVRRPYKITFEHLDFHAALLALRELAHLRLKHGMDVWHPPTACVVLELVPNDEAGARVLEAWLEEARLLLAPIAAEVS